MLARAWLTGSFFAIFFVKVDQLIDVETVGAFFQARAVHCREIHVLGEKAGEGEIEDRAEQE